MVSTSKDSTGQTRAGTRHGRSEGYSLGQASVGANGKLGYVCDVTNHSGGVAPGDRKGREGASPSSTHLRDIPGKDV
jgi:hypothetical protein